MSNHPGDLLPLEIPYTLQSGGLNATLYILALKAATHGFDPSETAYHLDRWNAAGHAAGHHHRRASRYEIERQVRCAYQKAPLRGPFWGARFQRMADAIPKRTPPIKPVPDEVRICELVAASAEEGFRVESLETLSPDRPPKDVKEALSLLFNPEELVCMGRDKRTFATRPLEWWLAHPSSLTHAQYIVPSPMRKAKGITQEGVESERCRDNAAASPRWMVAEWDRPDCPPDVQAYMLHGLAKNWGWPLALVVGSGGKSVHGWFDVQGRGASEFLADVVFLGGDPASGKPEQLFRTPQAQRDNGRWQTVVYCDRGVIAAAKERGAQ